MPENLKDGARGEESHYECGNDRSDEDAAACGWSQLNVKMAASGAE